MGENYQFIRRRLFFWGVIAFTIIFLVTSSTCFIDKTLLKEYNKIFILSIHLLISLLVSIAFVLLQRKLIFFSDRLKKKIKDETRLLDALQKSEERYRAIFDSSSNALILIDAENVKIVEYNEAFLQLTGLNADEIATLSPSDLEEENSQNIKPLLKNKEKTLFTAKKNINFITKLKKKNSLPVKVSSTISRITILDHPYLMCSFHDISEQDLNASRLLEQMRFSETILETTPIPIFYKNRDGRYLGCNTAFEKFIGLKRDQIVGKKVFEIAPKEIAEQYQQKDNELFENPGTHIYDWKLVNKKGEIREVIFHKSTYTNKKGEVHGLIGAISDITELRQKNRELRFAYERWQKTFDAFDDIIFVIDKTYNIVLSNLATKKNFYGEYIDGVKCFKIIHGTDSQPEICLCKNVFEDGQKRSTELFNKELNAYFDCSFYPLKNNNGEVEQVIHIMRNINARKKAETEMLRSRNVLLAQNKSLVKFTNAPRILSIPLDKFLKDILIELSNVLKITYTSIWFFDTEKTKLSCAYSYDSRKNIFLNSGELLVKDYSNYFDTILHDKLISADNAHSDPGTTDLLSSYLVPKGITSVMDSLISLGKDPLGIICCEHTGKPRNWTVEEANYLISISNIVSLYMQTSKIENTEKDLIEQIAKFNNLVSQTDVGLMVINENKKVVFVNKASEIFFGEKVKSILGQTCPNEIINAKNNEIQIIRKNGKKGLAIVNSEPCHWEGKKSEILTITDISDIK